MAYIDYTYYNEIYKGEPVDETDFPLLAERASRDIAELSGFWIKDDISAMTDDQQYYIKLATASQLEYLSINGISDNLANASLGKFSYSTGKTNYGKSVRDSLAPTGLLYRGLG